MSYNEVREVGVPNLDHNPPWNPDYYDHEDPQDETTTTAPPESYITMAELESIYHILLILFYIAIPVSLILLRCITIKNVPKLDVAFLFNAFTAWFWIIWFFIIWSENWFRLDGAYLNGLTIGKTSQECETALKSSTTGNN